MSDDRYAREPGDDDETYAPEPRKEKSKRWYQDVEPPRVTAEQIFDWLDNVYCKATGAKPGRSKTEGKP